MKRLMGGLTLCMIVKNEERLLPRCLESVWEIADEIVILDTGSTDHTIEIARNTGALVTEFAWKNDFAAARNAALARASGDWILHLDADEALEAGAKDLIRQLMEADAPGYFLTVRNFTPPGHVFPFFDSPQVRLFRNQAGFYYTGSVHETILPSIIGSGFQPATAAKPWVLHYGYQSSDAQGGEDRAKRNLSVLNEVIKQSPNDPMLLYYLGQTLLAAGQPAQALEPLERLFAGGGAATLDGPILETASACRAESWLAVGEPQRALECAQSWLALTGRNGGSRAGALELEARAYLALARSRIESADTSISEMNAVAEAVSALEGAAGCYRSLLKLAYLPDKARSSANASLVRCEQMIHSLSSKSAND